MRGSYEIVCIFNSLIQNVFSISWKLQRFVQILTTLCLLRVYACRLLSVSVLSLCFDATFRVALKKGNFAGFLIEERLYSMISCRRKTRAHAHNTFLHILKRFVWFVSQPRSNGEKNIPYYVSMYYCTIFPVT